MVWLHGSDPRCLGPQVHQQTGALPYPLQVLEYNLSQVSMCVSLTTEFRTFEQTLQPVSYSFSLSLLITSSFVALSVGGKSGWFCSKHQFPVCFLYLYLDVNTSKCTCIYFWMNKTNLLGLKALVSKPTYLELILTIICVVNSI